MVLYWWRSVQSESVSKRQCVSDASCVRERVSENILENIDRSFIQDSLMDGARAHAPLRTLHIQVLKDEARTVAGWIESE